MRLEYTSFVHLARFIVLILCMILSELTALCSLSEQVKVHLLICKFFSVKDQVYFSTV